MGTGATSSSTAAASAPLLFDTVLAHLGFLQRMAEAGQAWRLVVALGPHATALGATGSHLYGDALRFFRTVLQDMGKGGTPLLTLALRLLPVGLLPVGSPLYALAVAARAEQAG